MQHWYWCEVERDVSPGETGSDVNGQRVEAICKAHGLEVDLQSSDVPNGCYMIRLPEFPDHVEIIELTLGVGELKVKI
jgi:hypothetical protein